MASSGLTWRRLTHRKNIWQILYLDAAIIATIVLMPTNDQSLDAFHVVFWLVIGQAFFLRSWGFWVRLFVALGAVEFLILRAPEPDWRDVVEPIALAGIAITVFALHRMRDRARESLDVAHAELQETNRNLVAANESIKDFTALASHDMRNPLTYILGVTELLAEQGDAFPEDKRAELLMMVNQRGKGLERLIDDLLTVSKIDAGAVEAHTAKVIFARELAQVMDDLGPDAGDVSVVGDKDVEVRADADHFRRILSNYLSNAFKYGTAPIEVDVARLDGFVEIRVKDVGAGVAPEFASRLFTKFARASDDSVRTKDGTGLGLSIVRGLARANGGDAWYEPNVPHGACFAVKLPADSPQAA